MSCKCVWERFIFSCRNSEPVKKKSRHTAILSHQRKSTAGSASHPQIMECCCWPTEFSAWKNKGTKFSHIFASRLSSCSHIEGQLAPRQFASLSKIGWCNLHQGVFLQVIHPASRIIANESPTYSSAATLGWNPPLRFQKPTPINQLRNYHETIWKIHLIFIYILLKNDWRPCLVPKYSRQLVQNPDPASLVLS